MFGKVKKAQEFTETMLAFAALVFVYLVNVLGQQLVALLQHAVVLLFEEPGNQLLNIAFGQDGFFVVRVLVEDAAKHDW